MAVLVTKNAEVAEEAFERGKKGGAMIYRQVDGKHLLFESVEDARSHATTVVDPRAFMINARGKAGYSPHLC